MEQRRTRAKSLNQHLNPYPYFARLRAAGRVVRISTIFAGEGWLITRYDDAQRIATDPRLSVDGRNAGPELRSRLDKFKFRFVDSYPDHMLVVDPPDHTRLRRLVSKEFTPNRIAALEPFIRQKVNELLDAQPVDKPIDLMSALAAPLPVMLICKLLGVPQRYADVFRPMTSTLVELPVDAQTAARIDKARTEIWEYLQHFVADKRNSPNDGLVSALIAASEDGDRLSTNELTAMAASLFTGGAETTTNVIGSGLLLLLRHAAQWQKLTTEPKLVPTAVEELLRFEGPVTLGLIRYAADDISIGDVTIPKGDLVFVGLATSNHDGERFSEPEHFDISRQENAHLAFGRGTHYCIGAPLARLELQTFFSILASRFPNLRLAEEPDQIPWRSAALRGPAALPIILEPGNEA